MTLLTSTDPWDICEYAWENDDYTVITTYDLKAAMIDWLADDQDAIEEALTKISALGLL
jgi:hypothetical protein